MTTKKQTKIQHDLMSDIKALRARVEEQAKAKGLSRYLLDHGAISVRPHGGNDFDAADVSIGFQPNLGMDYRLYTPVTDSDHAWPIDTPKKRNDKAALFVRHMEYLLAQAKIAAASRAAIKRAAQEVFDEALREGFVMEVLRIEAAPVLIHGEPGKRNRHGECKQVFYVHVLMPHDDEGTLTEDAWTIDADDADEFADYLRSNVLPELRELRTKFSEPAAAA